ncbi:MAG: phosphodiester glycosidase family protein, partial [Desulfovibrionaceae bacterium]|nr:phosphodiester glycosidase family protein [Desulfovibrionaceae bacterium]
SLSFANTWSKITLGVDLASFPLDEQEGSILVLKIDPSKVNFVLGSAAAEKHEPLSLKEWAKSKNFTAVINASMYLPDRRTSTGYMRQGEVLNNGRISSKFGAFFVANPDSQHLPKATILERETPNLKEKLRHYGLVIQNFRLINSSKQILWPKLGPKHTIAAVATTEKEEILFIYATAAISAHDLAVKLLNLPLNIATTMYVEGGAQAGLFINHPNFSWYILPQSPLYLHGPLAPAIPNVLGIASLESF